MDLTGLRIGYAATTADLDTPSDRRRFVHYARKRGIPFELARPCEAYDVVVVTQRADISVWKRYRPGQTKIVYDAVDSYLAIPRWGFKAQLRGLSKFVTRQSRYLQLSYHKTVEQMCGRADAVICSTEEQKQRILRSCGNVRVILDFHAGDATAMKSDYTCGDILNFVWEGLASSGIPLVLLREILEPLARKRKIALHLITDLTYYRYHNLLVKRHTAEEVHRVFKGIPCNVYVYQWNSQMFSKIVCACDLALIPLRLDDPFRAGKPENKLLLFWRMAIPTIVSATPAYQRTVQRCDLPMSCTTLEEWHHTIEKYVSDEDARRHAGEAGKRFVEQNYGEEAMLRCWDEVFDTL